MGIALRLYPLFVYMPWLVRKDVAAALGYGKGKSLSNAIANHVDPEDKGVTELMTPGGMQKMIIINESGLYSLILSSKLPGAKKFRIRTGRALTRPTQNIIQKLHQVFQRFHLQTYQLL